MDWHILTFPEPAVFRSHPHSCTDIAFGRLEIPVISNFIILCTGRPICLHPDLSLTSFPSALLPFQLCTRIKDSDLSNRKLYILIAPYSALVNQEWRPPLWSSGQSCALQIQRTRVPFPALPDFLRSSGSGTGSTQPREDNCGAT
jgi:hypothetical protein